MTTKTLELCPVNLPVNSSQDEAIAREIMTCNTTILRECHTMTLGGKHYASVNTYKHACKHRMSAKE